MKNLSKILCPYLVLILIWVTAGCEGSGDSKDKPAEDNVLHMLEDKTLELYIESAGSFVRLTDGDYVEPGIHKLGVKVIWQEGVELKNQQVSISDGNVETSVESLLEENGYYVCTFEFVQNKYLTYPVLIQTISPDYTAARDKIILSTRNNLRPEAGMLVKKGFGVTLSDDLLANLPDSIQPLIAEQFPGATIKMLSPAENASPKDEDGVIHLKGDIPISIFTIPFSMDVILKDKDDNGVRGLNMGLEDLKLFNTCLCLVQWMIDAFFEMFDVNTDIPMDPVTLDLGQLIEGFGNTDESDDAEEIPEECGPDEESIVDLVMKNLQLDSTLFVNVFGIPDETSDDFAAIFGGLYATDPLLVEVDENDKPLWPEVEEDSTDSEMDFSKIKTDNTDLGLVISQYNLNQMLESILSNIEVELGTELFGDLIGDILPGYSLPQNDNVVNIAVVPNPAGTAIDFNSQAYDSGALLTLNDMLLNIIMNDEINPVISISLDLTTELSIKTSIDDCGKLNLDLKLTPILDLCHWNIMKDEANLGMTDDPLILNILLELLVDEDSGSIDVSFPLTDMGITPAGDDPGKIEFDEKGNCFMNLAIESIDTDALGICFISSARM